MTGTLETYRMESRAASDDEYVPRAARYRPFRAADERLSLPIGSRIALSASVSALVGFGLGAAHGATESGYRFRAENAHRLPKSQTGWYLYHKSKNYHAMLGGAKEGVKMSARVSAWAVLFVGMEEAIDGFRQGITRITRGEEAAEHVSKDFVSTVVAGLSTAGAFSLWNRFPLATAARTARTGIKLGVAYGLIQDAVSLLRGRRIGYVEFVTQRIRGTDNSVSSPSSQSAEG